MLILGFVALLHQPSARHPRSAVRARNESGGGIAPTIDPDRERQRAQPGPVQLLARAK
jgi:hypothetical protein